jgi:2-oxoisovalerate dehydrogenase E2 component (dihydrolipoyl transacylase)
MSDYVIRLPDVGEGVAEAEIVEWHVNVGDSVSEDDVLAEVMTDKATVELPSPVHGVVRWLGAEVGDIVAVGSDIVRIETDAAAGPVVDAPAPTPEPVAVPTEAAASAPAPTTTNGARAAVATAAPAVRARAARLGIDLATVTGSGPEGRVVHEDLDTLLAERAPAPAPAPAPAVARDGDEVEDVKIVGLRRNIAERMQASKRRIPHFTYVEEVDVTALEELRRELNDGERPRLSVLPFLMRAVVVAIRDHPEMNARFDDEAGVVNRHRAVHLGIAVQTPRGLMVPVVKDADVRDLWSSAAEVARLSEAARTAKVTLEELSGSTITITSLGALGGIVTTPVINAPEVAIIGVNKIATRPVFRDGAFVPRQVMNLSSSFDHRVVDGADAAAFIQRIRVLLEQPALLFVS